MCIWEIILSPEATPRSEFNSSTAACHGGEGIPTLLVIREILQLGA